jgi:hypothetical protein
MTKQELILKVMSKPQPKTRNLKPSPAELQIKYTNKGCWEWQGELSHFGVPKFGKYSARRMMYDRHIAAVQKDEIVLSSCGNYLCVSPYHAKIAKLK